MLPDIVWLRHWRCILPVQCCWAVPMATPYRAAKCRMKSGGGRGAAHNWFRSRLPVVGGESFRDAFNITLASRPVYLSGDPVTQRLRQYAVGWPYRIVPESASNLDQRGARISALRHEPFNIRKYLIKDLEKKGIKLDEPPREPWETYEDLKELLSRQEKDQGSARKVSEILGPDFNARLVKYLGVLQERVSDNQKPKVNF